MGQQKKTAYIGAGAGLVLFVLIGLLPGSLLGGALGLTIVGSLFGFPVSSALLPRLIVGMSMLLGVFASGALFIAGSAFAGWLIGSEIDSLRIHKPIEAEVKN